MKKIIDNKGFTLLEIIIGISIFSIFILGITLSFSTYTKLSNQNNLLTIERIKIVSNLEEFLSNENYDVKKDKKSKLIITSGFKKLPKEIEIFEREIKSKKTNESMKAFVKSNESINNKN